MTSNAARIISGQDSARNHYDAVMAAYYGTADAIVTIDDPKATPEDRLAAAARLETLRRRTTATIERATPAADTLND